MPTASRFVLLNVGLLGDHIFKKTEPDIDTPNALRVEREWGENISLPSRLGSVRSCPCSGVRRPAENDFCAFFIRKPPLVNIILLLCH